MGVASTRVPSAAHVFSVSPWSSTRAWNICCLCTPFSSSTTPNSTCSPSPALRRHFWAILLCGSLLDKPTFLAVIPVDATISVSYTGPFHCSQNLHHSGLSVPAGWCQRCEVALGRRPWGQAGCGPAAQVVLMGTGPVKAAGPLRTLWGPAFFDYPQIHGLKELLLYRKYLQSN